MSLLVVEGVVALDEEVVALVEVVDVDFVDMVDMVEIQQLIVEADLVDLNLSKQNLDGYANPDCKCWKMNHSGENGTYSGCN